MKLTPHLIPSGFFLLLLSLMASAQELQPAPSDRLAEPPSQAAAQTPQEKTSESSEQTPPRRRIIDPQQFKVKTPFPGNVLLAPFRALAPKARRGLTLVEDNKILVKVQRWLSRPDLRPVVGGLGDGSGFGGGVYLASTQNPSDKFKAWLQTQFTTRLYTETRSGIELNPQPESSWQLKVEVEGRHRLRPEEDFWGIGFDSKRAQRSTYNLQESGIGTTTSINLTPRTVKPVLRVGAGLDYSHTTIRDGRDVRFARISTEFAPQIAAGQLPGFIGATSLLSQTLFAEFDARDSAGNPEAGFFARFSVTNHDSVNRADYGFVNTRTDLRGYIPLGTKHRTLALRLVNDLNRTKGNSAIPFFRLSRLGDQNTLRGFDTYRYHGKNSLLGSLEYHWQLVRGVKWMTFTDIGQVYNTRRELTRRNMRATWGTGLEFASERSLPFRIIYAHSAEGSRLFLSFGTTF